MYANNDYPILFQNYPDLISNIDWLSLGIFPTPVEPLQNLGCKNLWIKRDDLSSSLYGGNKVRKLEFALAAAKRKNKRHLITLGGIGTNHGLATAAFCEQVGIDCSLVLFRQPVTRHVQRNLKLFTVYNAHLHYKKSLFKAVLSYYLLDRIRYPNAYFLHVGGSNTAGTIGSVSAAFELKAQVDRGEIPEPAVVICPLSSCGTLAGIALGARLAGLNSKIIGVRVTFSHFGPFQNCTAGVVLRLMQNTYRCLQKKSRAIPDIPLRAPTILHDYFGDGYGCPTAAGNEMMRLAEDKEGLKLDPTYTAKTMAAVLDYCRNRQASDGSVLYWHTYNSVNLSARANSVDDGELPPPLREFVRQAPLAI